MGYVVAAWLFTAVLLAGYAASIALRRRAALAEAADLSDVAGEDAAAGAGRPGDGA